MVQLNSTDFSDYPLQTAASRPQRPKTMNFGKFYQTSYLDMNGNVIKKGSVSSPNLQPPASFHRPGESASSMIS